jgi:hypothetical protein
MSNTEWKKGYEEGFAAGWKAARSQSDLNYKNYPPVYYGGEVRHYPHATMADTMPSYYGYSYNVETTTLGGKKINNLTNHTKIV